MFLAISLGSSVYSNPCQDNMPQQALKSISCAVYSVLVLIYLISKTQFYSSALTFSSSTFGVFLFWFSCPCIWFYILASPVIIEALLDPSAFMPFILGKKLPTTLNFPISGTVHNSEPQDSETWYFTLSFKLYLLSITASDYLLDLTGSSNNHRRCVIFAPFLLNWLSVKWSDLPNDTQLITTRHQATFFI